MINFPRQMLYWKAACRFLSSENVKKEDREICASVRFCLLLFSSMWSPCYVSS